MKYPTKWRSLPKERLVPEHMRPSFMAYFVEGLPPEATSFFYALLSNNFKEAFIRADEINRVSMSSLVEWLYNHAPAQSWGSPDAILAWSCLAQTWHLIVKDSGREPEVCPRCRCLTLWPENRKHLNAESRETRGELVCTMCGTKEALLCAGDRIKLESDDAIETRKRETLMRRVYEICLRDTVLRRRRD